MAEYYSHENELNSSEGNKSPEIFSRDKNPFESDPTRWAKWEKECIVKPVVFALVDLKKPYDLAHAAQISLATQKEGIPHVGFEMVGVTTDFSDRKISGKIASWNIEQDFNEKLPRRRKSLEELRNMGYRLVGTVPENGENALDFEFEEGDLIVVGGPNGLSDGKVRLLDKSITIPSAIPFMTTTSVIPILTYNLLHRRGLW